MENKRNTLVESEKFLKEQSENNKQIEESIKKLEKNLCNIREEQQKAKEMLNIYENQVRGKMKKILSLQQNL